MKKLFLIVSLICMTSVPAFADSLDISSVLDNVELKQGVAWSLEDSKLNYLSTIEILSWKGITLEAGYAGAAKETAHKAVAVVSYPIVKLKDFVDVPIVDKIELNVGAYAGYGNISTVNDISNDNEFDYGLSLTLLSFKF